MYRATAMFATPPILGGPDYKIDIRQVVRRRFIPADSLYMAVEKLQKGNRHRLSNRCPSMARSFFIRPAHILRHIGLLRILNWLVRISEYNLPFNPVSVEITASPPYLKTKP